MVKDGAADQRRRLVCFTEDGRAKIADSAEFTTPAQTQCRIPGGDIAGLDVLPAATNQPPSVIVTYQSGAVVWVSADLSEMKEHQQANSDRIVEYALALDVDTARKGILRNREDVFALLDQNSIATSSSILLCQLIRSNEGRELLLYAFRLPPNSGIQTAKPSMGLVMSYLLPSSHSQKSGKAQYELHARSGMLYQNLNGSLNVYDLSGTIPKALLELGGKTAPISSFAHVSEASILCNSDAQATVYETSFGTAQASVSLFSPVTASTTVAKRKRDDSSEVTPTASFKIVSSFAELGLVVGQSNNELLAVQLRGTTRSSKHARSHGTAIGDAVSAANLSQSHVAEDGKAAKRWNTWRAEVDRMIEADDIEGLERLVADDAELGKVDKPLKCKPNETTEKTQQTSGKMRKKRRASEGSTEECNGNHVPYEDRWPQPGCFDGQHVDGRKAFYFLGKVFAYGDAENTRLEVQIASTRLLLWLALVGFLNASHLQKALQSGPENHEQGGDVKPGDVMVAIRQMDDGFELMHSLLSLTGHWEVEELVQALRLLVQSFEETPVDEPPLALPALPHVNGDVPMTNGDDTASSASDLELESKIAEVELDQAMDTLATGLEVRSDSFRVVLAHLRDFPHGQVTTSMRTLMSHRELIFFIHVLRIELAEAGWTSKYTFDVDDGQEALMDHIGGEEDKRPNDQAITLIGKLLNCAVDAIGISGWLVGLSSTALGTDELLDSLRAEVSAALEGCYESSTLGSLLEDLDKCATSTEKAMARSGHYVLKEYDEADKEEALLPLGGRLEPPDVSGRGGRKSKMVVAQEKSKRVGKYSFDRLRI